MPAKDLLSPLRGALSAAPPQTLSRYPRAPAAPSPAADRQHRPAAPEVP